MAVARAVMTQSNMAVRVFDDRKRENVSVTDDPGMRSIDTDCGRFLGFCFRHFSASKDNGSSPHTAASSSITTPKEYMSATAVGRALGLSCSGAMYFLEPAGFLRIMKSLLSERLKSMILTTPP